MKSKTARKRNGATGTTRIRDSQGGVIASPKAVLSAAEKAPRVFNIGAYFRALYLMRDKGHSWRYLTEWLRQFNIEISYVHLNRLYAQESERLSRLTRSELEAEGMPSDYIDGIMKEFREKSDPTKRLPAIDAEDIALEGEEEQSR